MATQDLAAFTQSRLDTLSPQVTTTTSSGAIVHWISPEKRLYPGGNLATPPPAPATPTLAPSSERLVGFELEQPAAELGPEGTVPIAGKRLDALGGISVQTHVSKPGSYGLPAGQPTPSRGFFRATTDAETACYGISAAFTVWSPTLEDETDHSLAEIWLVDETATPQQSVEAGWTVSRRQYGDTHAHLFTWYTTTAWTDQNDWIGSYDTDYAGWIQIDRTIYPGTLLLGASQIDAQKIVMSLQYQLWNGNWWLAVNGRWIGYYPSEIFARAGADNLHNGANRALAGGEIFSQRDRPETTTTQMGSGNYPGDITDAGRYAYARDVTITTDPQGSPTPIPGTNNADNPDLYNITACESFESAYLFGGPNPPRSSSTS